VTSLFAEVRDAVRGEGVPFATALQVVTSNPARILKLRGKGALAAGADADIVLLDASSLEIDGVIAKGRWLMKARVPLARGTFE
jgi:beta-aspartyl-dipeptidase (metallo-type)